MTHPPTTTTRQDAYLAVARTQNPNTRRQALHPCLSVTFQTRISGFTQSAFEEGVPPVQCERDMAPGHRTITMNAGMGPNGKAHDDQ